MKTHNTTPSEIKRKQHIIDASGKVLGRLTTQVARLLTGKNKTIYSPNLDCGDFVVVINAAKVRVTGRKPEKKMYYRHSMYPGGFKSIAYEDLMEQHPTRIIEHAVKGMLPHNRLGRVMIKKLKVYAGEAELRPPRRVRIQKTKAEEKPKKAEGVA